MPPLVSPPSSVIRSPLQRTTGIFARLRRLSHALEQIGAPFTTGQALIDDHRVGGILGNDCPSRFDGVGVGRGVAVDLKHFAHDFACVGVVVYYQHIGHGDQNLRELPKTFNDRSLQDRRAVWLDVVKISHLVNAEPACVFLLPKGNFPQSRAAKAAISRPDEFSAGKLGASISVSLIYLGVAQRLTSLQCDW